MNSNFIVHDPEPGLEYLEIRGLIKILNYSRVLVDLHMQMQCLLPSEHRS